MLNFWQRILDIITNGTSIEEYANVFIKTFATTAGGQLGEEHGRQAFDAVMCYCTNRGGPSNEFDMELNKDDQISFDPLFPLAMNFRRGNAIELMIDVQSIHEYNRALLLQQYLE